MKYKFKVGQVVRYDECVYEISYHYRAMGENFYMLKLQGDDAFDSAPEKELRSLTQRQKC